MHTDLAVFDEDAKDRALAPTSDTAKLADTVFGKFKHFFDSIANAYYKAVFAHAQQLAALAPWFASVAAGKSTKSFTWPQSFLEVEQAPLKQELHDFMFSFVMGKASNIKEVTGEQAWIAELVCFDCITCNVNPPRSLHEDEKQRL